MISWIADNIVTLQKLGGLWLAIGAISLLLTLIALPIIIIRLPADYFVRQDRVTVASSSAHPAVVMMANAFKNFVGIVLIIFGAIMLFIPGQGILTMLIGLMLTNFPGKYHLEQKIVARPAILRTLNRIRERAGHEPLAVR
ncbi:MAG: hypothetical protein OER80_05655 [Gammaproteobacteria bacterium]|nr:hypothetical protein [Gammaproteobacteria bacterium]MDH3769235.1 hypothetical protein [Gammaproteobacteria bacterium]